MGYVKLNRNLLRWEWFDNNNALLVLVRLTLKAAWRDTQYQGVALKRGQVVTTIAELEKENQLTRQVVYTLPYVPQNCAWQHHRRSGERVEQEG